MVMLAWVAACCAAMAVLLHDDGHHMRLRLHGSSSGASRAVPARIGVAACIAAVCAALRGGGTVVEACEEQAGCRFAVPRVTVRRLRVMLAARALPKETAEQVDRAAAELAAACAVSATLGCPAAPCLEAVGVSYRRGRLLEDLREQAFAVPRATMLLLCALPVVTVLLGELLGAKPIAFLLGSAPGAICLMMGGCWYAVGVAWMRVMMHDLG